MNGETELKPCPFCGSEATLVYTREDEKRASVSCRRCHAVVLTDGREFHSATTEELVKLATSEWNLRAKL